jgi:uncharacterized membrane protein
MFVDKLIKYFKKKVYGKTFTCPVCHLELSYSDLDKHNCLVCPLCGVVIEEAGVYGHSVPVINDVEIYRTQPNFRLHPLATHLPIGLFPFALLGAVLLLILSIYMNISGSYTPETFWGGYLPAISNMILIMLFLSTASSIVTFISGVVDWNLRYRKRPYRIISLKISLTWLFLFLGIVMICLHGFVFQSGAISFVSSGNILSTLAYFFCMGAAMITLSILGHIGGYLVFGK